MGRIGHFTSRVDAFGNNARLSRDIRQNSRVSLFTTRRWASTKAAPGHVASAQALAEIPIPSQLPWDQHRNPPRKGA